MICPDCQNQMLGNRCSCGYEVKQPSGTRDWILRECMVEGCRVVIRELPGDPGPAFCKWHQDGQAHQTKRPQPAQQGPFITREQFGEALYEAIKCCGGILQLQAMQQSEQTRENDALRNTYKQRETALHQALAAIVPKLPVMDQEAMIRRYPQLFR